MTQNDLDFKTFKQNFNEGKTQLVWQWISADLDTPVSAYMKLCHEQSHSFLLESVEGGAVLGRYSAIGFAPDLYWRCDDGQAHISTDNQSWQKQDTPALESLKTTVANSHLDITPDDLPPMAPSGLFGYMGYDMIRLVEDIADNNPDDLNIPQGLMIRPTIMVIFDNVRSMICIATPVRETSGDVEEIYQQALMRLSSVQAALQYPVPQNMLNNKTTLSAPLEVSSNMSREDYHDAVKQGIEYIKAGDIFQVVPSQRFSVPFDLPSLELYRSLRRINPSPFLFHLDFDGFSIVGSSPEILVRVRDNTVTIRPIAGTRKRGKTAAEDKALAEDLLGDEKECAEHLMLLDLGRNDIGRVSEIGSVNVTDQFIIERYSHVMHIVSNVEGQLAKDTHPLDALFSGFPAGTVSGAPKIRAMNIIDELEPVKRSFYGGAIGYLDGSGDVDTCIALRTGLIKDGRLYVQAGGGVVADSDPEFEYQETRSKARALIVAAENAIEQAVRRSEDEEEHPQSAQASSL